MTNKEAIKTLILHQSYWREKLEIEDGSSAVLSALESAIEALEKLERIERTLRPKTRRELMAEDDLAQALTLLRTLADL